jgi:uncharacterized protein (TIGR00297 family)
MPEIAIFASLSCIGIAGIIELFSKKGIDNLTLPIGISLVCFLIIKFTFLMPIFICLNIGLLILILAYGFKAISLGGFIAAAMLGVLTFVFGSWPSFIALIAFFILGSLVSFVGKAAKKEISNIHGHKTARGVKQVLANGLPPLIFALIYFITKEESFLVLTIAAFAGCTADTFSSEIGMLSKKQPVSILNFKKIQKGLSGGVTILGLCGALLGSTLISIIALICFNFNYMIFVIIVGFINAIIDSIMGATLQGKYKVPNSELLSEKRVKNSECVSGFKLIDNNAVNFLSTTLTGIIAMIFFLI